MVVKGPAGPTHRQRQAQATRAQVARAARELFARRGYVATTIAMIAEAADIPAPTIYSAFGNKAAILSEIADRASAELDVIRTHERARAAADPADGLRVAANLHRRQCEAMFDVQQVFQEAARVDPDVAARWREIQHNRRRAFHDHLGSIADGLAPGLTVRRATDRYLALVLPEIYRTLVRESGWSPDEYEHWLAATMIEQLLPSGAQRAAGTTTVAPSRQ
jgi:AcrR family transcriptional regulator